MASGAAIEIGAMNRTKSAPKAARKWWTVHQWVGLKLSLFMTFIMFTGTLAVMSTEIDWLLQPDLRVAPSSVEGPVAWATMVENADNYPGVANVTAIAAPTASAFAAIIVIERTNGDPGFLYAHPSTGEIQGLGPWVGAQRVLRNMHRHLNLPVKYGVPIVSSLAFLLLVTLVSSFVVYKKWWRGFAKPIRSNNARTWWGDFHRLAGVWSLWFIALIALTSLWYFVESLGGDAPSQPQVEVENLPDNGSLVPGDLATAFDAAIAAHPDLRIKRVLLPGEGNPLLQVQGDYEAVLVRERSNTVWVDTRNGEIKLITDGRDLNLHQRIGEMADPLHFGYFGGYWTKVPWFLFGLLLTGLSLSGAAIYSLRIAGERGKEVRVSRAFSGMWRGMGKWRWVSVVLVAIAFALLPTLVVQSS